VPVHALLESEEGATGNRNKTRNERQKLKHLEDKCKRPFFSKSKELYEKCKNTGSLAFVTQERQTTRRKQLATVDKEMAERLLALTHYHRQHRIAYIVI